MRVLVLGGTTEASALMTALAGDARFRPVLSLAGRTRAPVLPAGETRRGGFGGVDGLVAWLRAEQVGALVDATHPFAAQMSAHAAAAAAATGVPRLAVWRPGWMAEPGDDWTEVADMDAAVRALGPVPRRVFLTVGQQELLPFRSAPWHDYLVRSVEPPVAETLPPGARWIAARGPFLAEAEVLLLRAERVEVVVTKNSGGSATVGKLVAARQLGIPVVMVERPAAPVAPLVGDVAGVLEWLDALQPALRGV